MVDATQHDGVGWVWGMMLMFLELTHMVDGTTKCINGCGGNISVSKHHKTLWKNFKKFWRSKSKCQNASSFRVHKKADFRHRTQYCRMGLTKRELPMELRWKKSRGRLNSKKPNGNTDSKLSKIQAMYWKHHGRLHTVYLVQQSLWMIRLCVVRS